MLIQTAVLALTFMLLSPVRATAGSIGFSFQAENATQTGDLRLLVKDDVTFEPISDADVIVSETLGASPAIFRGQTDANGRLTVALGGRALSAVSVVKGGYTSFSLIGARAGDLTVHLKPTGIDTVDVMASGTLRSWKPAQSARNAIGGLVFKSISAMDLLGFHIDSFVSPLNDTIDVFGPREIPSNTVVPAQDIFLPIGSISLNKPDYRLPLMRNHPTRLTGVQMEVRVTDLLPYFTGSKKMSMEILNKVHVRRVGMTHEFTPDRNFQLDFGGVLNLSPRHQVIASQPPFPADVLAVAATDLMGDRQVLIPTDIKCSIAQENPEEIHTITLAAPEQNLGQAQDVMSVAIADRGGRVSAVIVDQAGPTVRPGPFLNAAKLASYQTLPRRIELPVSQRGLSAAVFTATHPNQDQRNYSAWMVYALPEAGSVSIPTGSVSGLRVEKYAVTLMEFDSSFSSDQIDGHRVMRKLQRFTRSAAEAQN